MCIIAPQSYKFKSHAHGFQLNTEKSVQCDFALTKSQTSSIPQRAVGGKMLPTTNDSKNLSVSSSSDLTWWYNVEHITSRCEGLGFVLKNLRSFSIPQFAICRFVDTCALPPILYSSPGIYICFAAKGLRTSASDDGTPYANPRETIITPHFATCNQLASRILGDSIHPLHSYIEAARTHRSTWQMFRLLLAKTEAYKKSIIPFLARVLCDLSAVTAELRTNLSSLICIFYHFCILNRCLQKMLAASALRQLNTSVLFHSNSWLSFRE